MLNFTNVANEKIKNQGGYFPRLNSCCLLVLSCVNQTLIEYNYILGTGMIKLVRHGPGSLSWER